MGIKLFSSDKYEYSCLPPAIGNPDPNRYTIKDSLTVGNYLIVEIQYDDCRNYEGRKILVYEGITLAKLKNQGKIDPHFSENKDYKSPIARFEPTHKGWRMAETFVKAWMKLK